MHSLSPVNDPRFSPDRSEKNKKISIKIGCSVLVFIALSLFVEAGIYLSQIIIFTPRDNYDLGVLAVVDALCLLFVCSYFVVHAPDNSTSGQSEPRLAGLHDHCFTRTASATQSRGLSFPKGSSLAVAITLVGLQLSSRNPRPEPLTVSCSVIKHIQPGRALGRSNVNQSMGAALPVLIDDDTNTTDIPIIISECHGFGATTRLTTHVHEVVGRYAPIG